MGGATSGPETGAVSNRGRPSAPVRVSRTLKATSGADHQNRDGKRARPTRAGSQVINGRADASLRKSRIPMGAQAKQGAGQPVPGAADLDEHDRSGARAKRY